MNAADEATPLEIAAEALRTWQREELSKDFAVKYPTTLWVDKAEVPAAVVLSALNAAGFTIAPNGAWAAFRARLQERLVMARGVLDEQGYGDVAALVPLEEVLTWMDELGGSGRLVQAGWEYRDPAWPDWRWHLSLDEPVAWETRHPVYRIEGE